MKNFIYISTFILFILSCKPGVPKELIQPDKMALVLHDIHVFDAYIVAETNRDTAVVKAASYYNAIYKKFGVDSVVYAKSLAYYTAHPRIMDEIYQQVTDQLKTERNKLIKADSLINLKAAKVLKARLKADSVKRADSIKIAVEKEKLAKKLDSAKNPKGSLKERRKQRELLRKTKAALLKKRRDSLNKVIQFKKRLNKRIEVK